MVKKEWDNIISPRKHLLDLRLGEIVKYYDLLAMFVKRDIVVLYKQTVLGPLWFFVQPILTTLTFIIVFGNIAGIPTDGIPQPLFYMAGIIIWNFFADCFTKTSNTFSQNADMFGKVYFPRLISPISVIVSNGVKFVIQLSLFLTVYAYYLFSGTHINPSWVLTLFPLLIFIMALLGLAFGLIFSSLTTKYRDLNFLIQFGVQLLMYATPVIYPVSQIPEKYRGLLWANPLSHIIEAFKFGFFGEGSFSPAGIAYSLGFGVFFLLLGIIIFNKTERTFMDTV